VPGSAELLGYVSSQPGSLKFASTGRAWPSATLLSWLASIVTVGSTFVIVNVASAVSL
jgi:hypothetical protein